MSPRLESTDVTLEQVIVNAIDAALLELHTGLPAKVIIFDPSTQSCDVQPLLQRVYLDADAGLDVPVELPQIQNVPIEYPAGGGFAITWPLSPGDIVYLAFCERSIDGWLEAAPGLSVDPLESRKHHLSDAVARAGLRQRRGALPGLMTPTLRVGLEDGTALFEVTADGNLILSSTVGISLGGPESVQPFVRGTDLLQWLANHTHPYIPAAVPAPAAVPTLPPTVPPPGTILSTLIKGV